MKETQKKPGKRGQPHKLENVSQFYIDKFNSMLETQPNGCVYFKGNVQNSGYCNYWYRYQDKQTGEPVLRFITAHRFAALISGKFDIDEFNQLCVLHHCDSNYANNDITYRQCVCEDHLWLGSAKDNIQDCIKKGRYIKPPTHYGADNHNARLTEEQAQWVIENHYQIPQRKIAKILNVNASTIEAIHSNKTWCHLPR